MMCFLWGLRPAEEGLDFGEGLFTRREIWGKGRQKQELSSLILDELLPCMQTGEEDVLAIGLKWRDGGRTYQQLYCVSPLQLLCPFSFQPGILPLDSATDPRGIAHRASRDRYLKKWRYLPRQLSTAYWIPPPRSTASPRFEFPSRKLIAFTSSALGPVYRSIYRPLRMSTT